jgi:hypothetical protein
MQLYGNSTHHMTAVYEAGAENTEWFHLFTCQEWCKLTIFGQWLFYVPPSRVCLHTVFLSFVWYLTTNGVYTMRYEVKHNVITLTRFWRSRSGVPAVSGQFSCEKAATWRRGLVIGVSRRRLWVRSRASACDEVCVGFAPEYVGFLVALSV